MTIPRNTFLCLSLPLSPHMGSFISPLVLTFLKIVGWLGTRIVIWLRPLALSYSIISFLVRFYLNHLLILCHPSFYMITFIIPFFFLTNLSRVFSLESLVVLVLFIFLLLNKTSSQLKASSMSSWVTPDLRGVTNVILLTQTNTSSLSISPPLRAPPSPLQSILMFPISYHFPLSHHFQTYLLHLQTFCLNHSNFIPCRHCIKTGSLLTYLMGSHHL